MLACYNEETWMQGRRVPEQATRISSPEDHFEFCACYVWIRSTGHLVAKNYSQWSILVDYIFN